MPARTMDEGGAELSNTTGRGPEAGTDRVYHEASSPYLIIMNCTPLKDGVLNQPGCYLRGRLMRETIHVGCVLPTNRPAISERLCELARRRPSFLPCQRRSRNASFTVILAKRPDIKMCTRYQ